MRPYQVVATEKIVKQIEIAHNAKWFGSIKAGGYVWHSTGSGKTLTSFKTAKICCDLPFIKKVIFVVDRKDLDYQTMKEYDKFEKGAANSNSSTDILKKQLEKNDNKIIITTIQKLSILISHNPNHPIYSEEIVLIFDECHRSQFGLMHDLVIKYFKKYYIFGFTGTPIFATNSAKGNKKIACKTTEQVFGVKLHTYTIVNAIHDQNILPFRIDYIKTMKSKDEIDEDIRVRDIDRNEPFIDDRRISLVTNYVLEHFNQKTKRNDKTYNFNVTTNITEVANQSYESQLLATKEKKQFKNITGFNSIFACESIPAAKKYYMEFSKQQELLPLEKRIKIGLIYSWSPNEDETQVIGLSEENNENVDGLDADSRSFLDDSIKDYNLLFKTNYDTSSKNFQNYYKDISLRMKNRELDLLIVVNMFLTGFDATTLNTIWIDKNVQYHGLIQSFSRTNRILNSIKTFGNIVCFRQSK
jgi:type I restriction enzyme R subunit